MPDLPWEALHSLEIQNILRSCALHRTNHPKRICTTYFLTVPNPYERNIWKDSEREKLLKEILKYEAVLEESLDETQAEVFEKYRSAVDNENCYNECDGFVNGFRLGVKPVIAVFHAKQ